RCPLAKDAYIHVRNGREQLARHFWLTPGILTNEANERLMIFPSHVGDSLQTLDNLGQIAV
ncbi:MAG: hypothetical protein DMG78_31645, partial [Acidobacteria bacterium]